MTALVHSHGASALAVELLQKSELVDLHIDTFIPVRIFGYRLDRRHGPAPLYGRLMGHLDWPRIQDGGLTGAMWSITTNPLRSAAARYQTFLTNLARIKDILHAPNSITRVVKDLAAYKRARAEGVHGAFLAIQGGNALEAAPDGPASIPEDLITRITLVHLTNSVYGATSAPAHWLRRKKGLTTRGKEFVEQLDAKRILVDLAHIHPTGFWDAVAVHDKSLPLIATHTGVSGVRPHWRNLDDRQIKAIADTGGTVGIIFSIHFLTRRGGPKTAEMVIEHAEHVIRVAGEDFVSVGSDFDGMIVPPPDLRSGMAYVVLVEHMLRRGWTEERIQKILGHNALRTIGLIRPGE
ncbi:MAG: membrane dipeptidase [Myxococcota bacterium]